MANHTPDTLLKLLQIMWSKQELIGKAVGAPLGFQMSKEFIEKLEEEPQASVSEFLFLWREAGPESTTGIEFEENQIHFTGFPYT